MSSSRTRGRMFRLMVEGSLPTASARSPSDMLPATRSAAKMGHWVLRIPASRKASLYAAVNARLVRRMRAPIQPMGAITSMSSSSAISCICIFSVKMQEASNKTAVLALDE